MAWQTLSYRLVGEAPLLMHNGQTADPLNEFAKAIKQISSKRKKTDADYEEMARLEFLASLYLSPEGPVIPARVVDAVVIDAAKKSREGRTAKSGCFCLQDAVLAYDGPRSPAELWRDERFRHSSIVRIGQARVSRMRPVFREWSADIHVNVEDTLINPERFDDWMYVAGTQVGVGDWRPQHGRFTATRLNGK